ncbi:(2,3-dihydroxybenzoyl)adenylate synthase [Gordonia sp. (in: high G+C Gram-positive bacteria)]|jgi:2,3-dihydroxybenzoate-AMP ligase|uniref:(2,3-dihydroxybenzoyl)adenylate synthase n=1 Tax=Gordonia sp. (in: high G+C Gram-positive bacteria) TaxID=84139 RepID=UPI001E062D2C|nr:AMP-binding protein [Gordonia sp. (in: high G+C Gram-positive bacteria)]MCB1295395.1 AMP-binding protein [Gordonia sp. (in: high G+C Gram-positive bacteria)]HMS76913.1 AMP-binding protein [Gordonia sp. (in: high G+C Gram-positive bacteria)]
MKVAPWPQELADHYRAQGLWRGETFDDMLRSRAADPQVAPRTAVIDATTGLTYAELDDHVARLAAGLVALGICRDDRVLLQIPNQAEYVIVVFALFRVGALPVFGLPAHRENELVGIAGAAEAVAIVTPRRIGAVDHRALAESVAAQVPSLRHIIDVDDLATIYADPIDHERSDPSEMAFLQLSGGSTGIPKLIPRTHDDYLYSVIRSNEVCGVTADTVYLATLPVAHNFPMSSPGILGALYAGGTVALTESPSPSVAWQMVERAGVTMTGLVPPLARLWTETAEAGTDFDLSTLDTVLVGGARCPDELARRIGPALGVTLQQVFGMAEGLVCYTRLDDPEEVITSTQGRPMSEADELRLVTEDGEIVTDGPGFLETQGPYTIRGYWAGRSPESFAPDGWYRTGDVVELTAEGNMLVRGRGGDRVNRGGEKVSAEQLEEELLAHPAVRDAIVVAVADKFLGERTCAYVIAVDPEQPPTLPVLRKFVREAGLAEWKLPDVVKVIAEFPETGVGKVSRRRLRELLAQN